MELSPDNGVLGLMRGDEIGVASRELPPAEAGQPELVEVATDSIHLGRVKVTFRLASYRRGKVLLWHWVVKRADKLAPQ